MKFFAQSRDGQTSVELVVMTAVVVSITLLVARNFIRPAFQRALQGWDGQTGEVFKNKLKQRWY